MTVDGWQQGPQPYLLRICHAAHVRWVRRGVFDRASLMSRAGQVPPGAGVLVRRGGNRRLPCMVRGDEGSDYPAAMVR